MRDVVGLVRVSTEAQSDEDRGGIARQLTGIARAVASNGLNLIRMEQIVDVSGTNVKASPVFQGILQEVRSGLHGVVVCDLDRLMRPENMADFDILQTFEDAGAIIYTEGSRCDMSSPEGAFSTQIFAAVAGLERKKIIQRSQGAKEEKRKQGKCPSAKITLPRGVDYDRKENKWSYTPEVEPVKEAFRIVDEEGLANLCEVGRRVGIQPRTLHNLLRNHIYVGRRVYDKKRGVEKYSSVDGRQADRRKVKRDDANIIDVRVLEAGAVSDARFERVQALLAQTNTRWRTVRRSAEPNMLAGIAVCAVCGSRMYATSGRRRDGTKQAYYICKQNYYLNKRKGDSCEQPSIRKQDLDETVLAFVSEHVSSPEVAERMVASMEEASEDRGSDGNFQRMLNDVEKRLKHLVEAVEARALSLDDVKARRSALETERESIEGMIVTAGRRRAAAQAGHRIVESIVRGARVFRRRLDRPEKRLLLQAMFSSISFRGCSIADFQMNPMFFSDSVRTNVGTLGYTDLRLR